MYTRSCWPSEYVALKNTKLIPEIVYHQQVPSCKRDVNVWGLGTSIPLIIVCEVSPQVNS